MSVSANDPVNVVRAYRCVRWEEGGVDASQTLLEGRRGVRVRCRHLHGVALGVVRQDEVNANVIVVDLAVGQLRRASLDRLAGNVVRESWHWGRCVHVV